MRAKKIIERIMEETGLSRDEVEKKIKDKKEELKGLISEDGALFIISKELGVNIKDLKPDFGDVADDITIKDVDPNMKNLSLYGRVTSVFRVNEFQKKDGSKGKVGSFMIQDNDGSIRITAWDGTADMVSELSINDIVKIERGYGKRGRDGNTEVHVSSNGRFIVNPEISNPDDYPKIETEVNSIAEIQNKENEMVTFEGKIQTIYELKKVTLKSGKIVSLFTFAVKDDDDNQVKVTMWRDLGDKYSKLLEEGMLLKIENGFAKYNSYTKKNEVNFTNTSALEIKDVPY